MSSAAPAPKRQRTGSISANALADAPSEPVIDAATIKRHPDFWFDDGSIVLIAGDAEAFRVHRTILATNSEVFKDMLLVGDPGPTNQERIEGCPIVRLPDDVADVCRLLKAFYYPSTFAKETKALKELVSYLRIASKYVVPSIRDLVVSSLRTCYPSTRSEFCARPTDVSNLSDALYAVYAGVTFDIPDILPAAMYQCCALDTPQLVKGAKDSDGRLIKLQPGTVVACLAGKLSLLKLKHAHIDQPCATLVNDYNRESSCDDEDKCHLYLLNLVKEILWYYGDNVSFLYNDTNFDGDLVDENPLCSSCATRWKEIEMKGREKIWAKLPFCFGLAQSWPDLLAKAREE